MRVVWSRAALREVLGIYDYLKDFNPHAAAEVFAALIETGDGLVDFPRRGRPIREGDLREVMTAYPYIIRCRVSGETVRILRVRHTSRRPTSH